MSVARKNFMEDIAALREAVASEAVGAGLGFPVPSGVGVLRRGAAITGLIMLESFVRDRVEELLIELESWPGRYDDLPERFRRRATVDALPHIEKYAKMLKRQDHDYVTEVREQAGRVASAQPGSYKFTKFIAGDYTGNISDAGAEEMLRVFQVRNCWNGFHSLSVDVGFGVPSVREVLRGIVLNRHKCAHVAGYMPTAGDVMELPFHLQLVGICIDCSLSASVRMALTNWRVWSSETFDWRSRLQIYFVVPSGKRLRLIRRGARRARRVVAEFGDARQSFPKGSAGTTRLLVKRSNDGRPAAWDIA